MPPSRRALALVAVAAGLAGLGGCSSSGASPATPTDGGARPTIPTTTGPSGPGASTPLDPAGSTSATPLGTARQRNHLAGLLLTPADLPSGWSASTPAGGATVTGTDAATQAALAACVGIGDAFAHRVAYADSPTFAKQSGSVSASATLYRSPSDVTTEAEIFRDPDKATACMTSTLQQQIEQGGPSGTTVDGIDIAVGPGGSGDPSNVVGTVTGTIKVSIGSQDATVYLDIVYLSGPRTEAEIDFTRLDAPFEATLRTRLTRTIATRVARG